MSKKQDQIFLEKIVFSHIFECNLPSFFLLFVFEGEKEVENELLSWTYIY